MPIHWILNIFMFLIWAFQPDTYPVWKDAGYPCIVWDGTGDRPVCPYDPTGLVEIAVLPPIN